MILYLSPETKNDFVGLDGTWELLFSGREVYPGIAPAACPGLGVDRLVGCPSFRYSRLAHARGIVAYLWFLLRGAAVEIERRS